jgi:hypothetical protein
MQRLGDTSYWEAELDARQLSGTHTLSVTAIPSLGAWARATHLIACHFVEHVPPRVAPGCAADSATLSLQAGWNLISLPLVPLTPDPRDALAPIAGNYAEIMAYGASGADPVWQRFSPEAPAFTNDLAQLMPQQGYWLRLAAPASLTVLGNLLRPASVALRAGWNLVGYPSLEPRAIATALAGIADRVACVYAYDAATPDAPWRLYDPGAAPPVDEIVTLRPGVGYWIQALADCTWLLE